MSDKIRAYIAVYVSQVTVESSNPEISYEESFFLIKAYSPEDAQQKAVKYIEEDDNISYKNSYGDTVNWKVKEIMAVTNTLRDDLDLHEDVVDLYVRGFNDYEAYQSLFEETKTHN